MNERNYVTNFGSSFPETAPAAFRVSASRWADLGDTRPGPMDLSCGRLLVDIHTEAPATTLDGSDPVNDFAIAIAVPNPRHPLPRPPAMRHHADVDCATAVSWGCDAAVAFDLALNVLAAYLPPTGGPDDVRLKDGNLVSARAMRHHARFQSDFLLQMAADGGVVSEADIRTWIRQQDLR